MIRLRIQIEQNKSVLEGATPFFPNGVAILQITSLVLLHYIISFIQLHG